MKEIKLTSTNFDEEVLKNKETIIVDFYADWCGPCRAMGPVLEEVAEEKKVRLGKINIDEEDRLAERFNVMSIPTIIVYKNGEPAKTYVGVTPKEKILEDLK